LRVSKISDSTKFEIVSFKFSSRIGFHIYVYHHGASNSKSKYPLKGLTTIYSYECRVESMYNNTIERESIIIENNFEWNLCFVLQNERENELTHEKSIISMFQSLQIHTSVVV
jgi:hypothetical protein